MAMKRLIFFGSILGTLVAFLVACFVVVTTLIWLVRQWEPAPWMVWAVGLGMMGAAVAVIWRWWRLPAERRFRFSMQGMLVGITLFALWFGTAGMDLLRWGRTAAVIRDLWGHGVTVEYHDYAQPRGPLRDLSRRRFGYDLFEGVHAVEIHRDQGLAALLEHKDDLPDLEYVSFWDGRVTDDGIAGVKGLNEFPNLRVGFFSGCAITDSGLEGLTDWQRLEELHLYDCAKITDAGLTHLQDLPNLRLLTLAQENNGKMPVTDAGLAHVAGLHQLQQLWIVRIPVTDDGIAQLQDMKSLESIHFMQTKVTEEGVNAVCEALPDCLVSWENAKFPALCQIRQIDIWKVEPEESLLATITDVDRVAAIKEWLDEDGKQRYLGSEWGRDGSGGTNLSVRLEGHRRRLCEIGLGNGVYHSAWGDYCRLSPEAEEEIRGLLGVDAAEWRTGD
jgi:hypothetical protein